MHGWRRVRSILVHREETPEIESVSGQSALPKFAPEQFPEGGFYLKHSRGYRPQTVISVRVR